MGCGLTDLPGCLFDYFFDWILDIINAPFIFLLDGIKYFLTQQPSISTFSSLWAVIIYIISLFYGLFIIGAGFNLILASTSPERREMAKNWLKNVILMIIAVQASYFIYSFIAQLSSGLTAGITNLIDTNFFLLTIDNVVNVSLEMVLGIAYLGILMITVVIFSLIYLLGSLGVVFFPIGIFLYFIPPLQDIGKFIINKLLFVLFLPFFSSLILLAASQLMYITGLSYIKIILAMGAFLLIDVMLVIFALLAIIRSVIGVLRTDIARSMLLLKGYFMFTRDKK